MIVFGRLRWRNFLSTGNDFTEIDLSVPGTTLVVGPNGGGKSTITDALSFALYGKPYRSVTKTQLVNSVNQRDLLVELEMSARGSKWLVRRGMKPNLLEVYRDGELLQKEGSLADQQEVLERSVLRMNHRACMQVVVLGSASFVPFMELPASHRREVLEEILDTQIYGEMAAGAKERGDDLTRRLRELDVQRDSLVDKLAMRKSFDRLIEEDRKSRELEIEEKMTAAKSSWTELLERGMSLATELSTNPVPDDQSSMIEENLSLLAFRRAELKAAEEKRDFFKFNGECPSCGQDLDHDHVESVLPGVEDTIASCAVAITVLETQLLELRRRAEKRSEVLEKRIAIKHEIAIVKKEILDTEYRISLLEQDLVKIKNPVSAPQDEASAPDLEESLSAVDEERSAITAEKVDHSFVASLLKDGGIKAAVLKRYVPIVNALINKYLAQLDFFVEFELDENFNETIRSRFRDVFSYASFSEGEKARINLAILFAWRAIARRRNSAATNVVIMDEVFDSSLDVAGTDDFMKMLAGIVDDTSVVVISHREAMVDKFDRVIKIAKRGNFSVMERG